MKSKEIKKLKAIMSFLEYLNPENVEKDTDIFKNCILTPKNPIKVTEDQYNLNKEIAHMKVNVKVRFGEYGTDTEFCSYPAGSEYHCKGTVYLDPDFEIVEDLKIVAGGIIEQYEQMEEANEQWERIMK